MSAATDVLDRLYSHFILRDILAKVVPGFILLSTLVALSEPFTRMLHRQLAGIPPAVLWTLVYTLSYVTGMLLQFVGMKIRLIPIYAWPPQVEVSATRRSLLIAHWFLGRPDLNAERLRLRERFVVLKEMSGNFGFLALVESAASLAAFAFQPRHPQAMLQCAIALAVLGGLLVWQSYHHASEQRIWEQGELELPRGPACRPPPVSP